MVEFAEFGNLSESSHYHTIERLWRFTIQAATALEYLERRDVIHQSVLDYNFLVVAGFEVVIIIVVIIFTITNATANLPLPLSLCRKCMRSISSIKEWTVLHVLKAFNK